MRDLGHGLQAEIMLELQIWALREYPACEIIRVCLHRPPAWDALPLGAVHPVVYSELRRDLNTLQWLQ